MRDVPRLSLPDSRLGRLARLGAYASPLVVASLLDVPVCPTAAALRQPCPGCGITRATSALVHGAWGEALALNPISPLVVPLSAALAIYGLGSYVLTGDSKMHHKLPMSVGIGLSLALTVVWAMRLFGAFGGPVPV